MSKERLSRPASRICQEFPCKSRRNRERRRRPPARDCVRHQSLSEVSRFTDLSRLIRGLRDRFGASAKPAVCRPGISASARSKSQAFGIGVALRAQRPRGFAQDLDAAEKIAICGAVDRAIEEIRTCYGADGFNVARSLLGGNFGSNLCGNQHALFTCDFDMYSTSASALSLDAASRAMIVFRNRNSAVERPSNSASFVGA
jgi:hypothetical protein